MHRAIPPSHYLTPREAADYIHVAEKSLANWRCAGIGPRFVKLSRAAVRYAISDLDAFMAERTYTSTSEAAVGGGAAPENLNR